MTFSSALQAVAGKITLHKRLINNLFKVMVIVLPSAVLYHELSGKNNLDDISAAFWSQVDKANGWWLCSALLLVPFNWLAEVQKWRPFIARHETMSHGRALKAVLAGNSFAVFTPNRVGEYGGRILFVQPENQWKALMANVVGSLGQYIVLLAGGALGGIWFAGVALGWSSGMQFYSLCAAYVSLAILFYYFFNIRLIVPIALRIPVLRRWESFTREVRFLEKISPGDLTHVLLWSAFRYAVYSSQYFLLLRFFGITTGFAAGYAGIATIFLLQTVVPLPALAGLLVRGSLAVFIWSHFGANEISSLSTTFVLWIINLILPALIGTFTLFSVNITKSLGYEDD
ncbi:MAG: hypothetical protein EPGJADBJ_01189 [Saprospiraceae bacterium]|nr:hypothetical protein [Saprospiraceae bacterium]